MGQSSRVHDENVSFSRLRMHVRPISSVLCRVLCAQVVGTTSSEGFLVLSVIQMHQI